MNKKEYHKLWRIKNREKINKQSRERYARNRKNIAKRKRDWYNKNKIRLRPIICQRKKDKYKELREQIIYHYAGNPPKCQCCGFDDGVEFLVIDHVNGFGTKERSTLCAESIYRKIIREDYPKDYEVICGSCNNAKRVNGGICPHKQTLNIRER